MKGRLSPLLQQILKAPQARKELIKLLLSGQPGLLTYQGQTYRLVKACAQLPRQN